MSLASQDDEDCEEQTMNRVDRDRLVRCRKSIVDDLEVRAVTDFLLEKGVLDPETVELINSMVSVATSEKEKNDQVRKDCAVHKHSSYLHFPSTKLHFYCAQFAGS